MREDARVQYSSARVAVTAVKAKTTTTAVVAANEGTRRGLRIQNDGANNVYLALGQAAVLHQDILLKPGESWDGRIGPDVWGGAVNAIAETAEANLVVVEVE